MIAEIDAAFVVANVYLNLQLILSESNTDK